VLCKMFDMRLQVSINDGVPVRASLEVQGWLSAHLNLSSDPVDGGSSSLSADAIDASAEPNTTHSTWDLGTLSVGDMAQIRILSDGEADPPTKVTRTSESPDNLFANAESARNLLLAISVCDRELMQVIEECRSTESDDEFQRIAKAIGRVLVEMDRSLIQPTLRRQPELAAEASE
jgi:hypothetical protein